MGDEWLGKGTMEREVLGSDPTTNSMGRYLLGSFQSAGSGIGRSL